MENQIVVQEICPSKTQQRVSNGAILVDVREIDEVVQLAFDVPSSINLPLSVFEEYFADLPKDKELVMVCKSGSRSFRATGFLVNHGYDKVVNMKHGIIRWAQKGFPTIGDTASVLGNENSSCCSESSCC